MLLASDLSVFHKIQYYIKNRETESGSDKRNHVIFILAIIKTEFGYLLIATNGIQGNKPVYPNTVM